MSERYPNVKAILRHPLSFEWSLQGFGMLRLYLDERVRLHVWCRELAWAKSSVIHDHPWDFDSAVISGGLVNVTYSLRRADREKSHELVRIRCGEGGCRLSEPERVLLHPYRMAGLGPGDGYRMRAEELHQTEYEDGAVTLCVRSFRPDRDRDEALVCYPIGDSWTSAEPRPATDEEVLLGCQRALELWGR